MRTDSENAATLLRNRTLCEAQKLTHSATGIRPLLITLNIMHIFIINISYRSDPTEIANS